MKKLFFVLSVLILCISVVSAAGLQEPLSIKIIHTNDHHSHLDSDTYDLVLDKIATRMQIGGFARLVTLIDEERDENSILLNSGELNGTLYFSLFKGEPDFKMFNELKLDAYALGNHEFDEGDERLAELIEMANFPIVSSNVYPEKESPLYRVKDQIKPYVIKEIKGQKVGIIGILKVEKTKNSSLVSDDVSFTPEIETAKKYVKELEDQGINKIILLSHVGYYNDIVFARNVPGIDVIVGGDTHSLLGDPAELAAIGLAPKYEGQTGPFEGYPQTDMESEDLGAYPTTVTGPTGDPVHIVQAWSYAYGLGVLHVDFDAYGIATKAEGRIEIPVGEPFLQKNAAGKLEEVTGEAKNRLLTAIAAAPILVYAPISARVDAMLSPYRAEISASMGKVIGTISETMGFDRIPGAFNAGDTPSGSYAAFIVSEAFRQTNPKIDFAIQNAGGVRTQFLKGSFTVADAVKALPFSNTVVMLEMTGKEIKQVLNEAAYYSLNSGSTGAFPYAAGLRYDVDLSGAEGSVIINIEMQDRATGVWSVLDDSTTYTVSTNSFTALGKDNYLTFEKVRASDPGKFEDTYINYFVPLKEYIEKLPQNVLKPLDPTSYCLKSVKK